MFYKINFFENSFGNTIGVSAVWIQIRLVGCFVGPDLGPNSLQRLSADDASRLRVKNTTHVH